MQQEPQRFGSKMGKFADLMPNDETGDPDFTIHSLSELPKIMDQSR